MRLHAGVLHLWTADLDALDTPQLERLLDVRERERAARIVREPTRQRWMVARGLLRALLGAYTEEHPCRLRFALEGQGKPKLELSGRPQLHFNLSHSGGLAVYALTEMCAVGVDVELVAPYANARTHGQDFLRAWVRREAEGKRLGIGVSNTPAQARINNSSPWMAPLNLGPGVVGAVALATAPVDFQVYAVDFRACGSILPASTATIHMDEGNVSESW
jgi:phosphopantetheinyl transferase